MSRATCHRDAAKPRQLSRGSVVVAVAATVIELRLRRALHEIALRSGDVHGPGSAAVGVNVELQLLAVSERAEPLGVDVGLVDEDVLTVSRGGEEPSVPFRGGVGSLDWFADSRTEGWG